MSDEAMIRLEGLSRDVRNLEHRMDSVGDMVEKMSELTTSVRVLAVNMEQMALDQKRVADNLERDSERIRNLEMQPAENWKSAMRTIISTVISALVGAGLGAIIATTSL